MSPVCALREGCEGIGSARRNPKTLPIPARNTPPPTTNRNTLSLSQLRVLFAPRSRESSLRRHLRDYAVYSYRSETQRVERRKSISPGRKFLLSTYRRRPFDQALAFIVFMLPNRLVLVYGPIRTPGPRRRERMGIRAPKSRLP